MGCHRPRVADRLIFDKLVQVAIFGCAYWRIADRTCSATTLRRRRDEWIVVGLMEQLERIAREGYDRLIGLQLEDVSVDGCITKAPCGGELAGPSPVDLAPPIGPDDPWRILSVFAIRLIGWLTDISDMLQPGRSTSIGTADVADRTAVLGTNPSAMQACSRSHILASNQLLMGRPRD